MNETRKLNDPSRSPLGSRPQPGFEQFDADLQPDPELAEGPASSSRIVAFGVAVVVVLGFVFYGLNTTGPKTDSANTAATQSTPAAAPQGNSNTAEQKPAGDKNADAQNAPAQQTAPTSTPGATTGAAVPSNTQQPKSTPTGTEIDSSKGGKDSATK